MKRENFFTKHKAFSYFLSAIFILAAALILFFVWKPGSLETQVNTYTILNTSFSNLVKSEQTLLNAADDFGMSEEDAKALYKDKNYWTMYAILVDVDNQTGKDVVFDGFNYQNESGKGYFVKTVSDGETGIAAEKKGSIEINVLINCNELDDEEIDELLMNLDIEAKYYYVDSIYGDYPENPKYKELKLGGK